MINASTGTVKNFDCGDIGHKRLACPHRQEEGAEVGAADWEELTGSTKLSQVKESAAPPSQPNSVPPAPVVDQTVAESALPSTSGWQCKVFKPCLRSMITRFCGMFSDMLNNADIEVNGVNEIDSEISQESFAGIHRGLLKQISPCTV